MYSWRLAILLCFLAAPVVAQDPPADLLPPGTFGLDTPGFGAGGDVLPGEELKFEGSFVLEKGKRTGTLSVKVTVAPGWHTYSLTQKMEGIAPQASELSVPKDAAYRTTGAFVPSVAPEVHKDEVFDVPSEEHRGEFVWTAPIELKDGVDPESATLMVQYSGQVCTDGNGRCVPTDADVEASFKEYVDVVDAPRAPPQPTTDAKVAPIPAKPLSFGLLLRLIGMGMLGGLILNLMPCVLPVIGLKVFGFIEQAGESRGKILSLNLWYSAGLLSVLMVLATLSVTLSVVWGTQFSWGEQFTFAPFKIGLTSLVFAMALSFLGVWEIPLPGFVGSGASVKLQQKEGAAGAFFKGIFTTILATPCSGPFLGPLFGYTISQPSYVTYVIFASIALGMASPYILIGLFPACIRFLPKPGAWMETFKQFMGFVLLGTVVFLFTTIGSEYFIATLTLLFAIWFACWWIGRAMYQTKRHRKVAAWLGGVAFATAIGWGGFAYLTPQPELLEWEKYTPVALQRAQEEGKTVMVDFTADWCLTCKINLRNAINTHAVKAVVDENGVVPMIADWTKPNPDIKAKLAELQSNSIPVLAIYPAGRPEEVIVLRDLVTKKQVVAALKKAGRSQEVAVDVSGGEHTTFFAVPAH